MDPRRIAGFATVLGGARDIPVKTLPCRVEKLQRLAPDVMLVRLKLPAAERLQFLPGQYIEFLLKDLGRRSFSIANSPHDDGFIELHIRNYGGAFSTYVFTRMKEKEILRVEGPFGSFCLREDSDKPIILLASGTGYAPIASMLKTHGDEIRRRGATLYWGGRRPADLYMADWVQAQMQHMPQLSVVALLEARNCLRRSHQRSISWPQPWRLHTRTFTVSPFTSLVL